MNRSRVLQEIRMMRFGDGEHSHCNLDDRHWIAPHTARRLSCDASLVTVLEDKDGNVLESSHSGRQLLFKNPAGRTLETHLVPQFPEISAETAGAALRTMAPNVNARTAVTRWTGKSCDYGMAIDALLWRDKLM